MQHIILLITFVFMVLSCTLFKTTTSKNEDVYCNIYVCQNEKERAVSFQNEVIEIDKNKFALHFYNKPYDAENKAFYATQIALFYSAAHMPVLEPGKSVDSVACFSTGTGLATARSGKYESLSFDTSGHHYLFYQNEKSKRVKLLHASDDILKLEFEIDSLNFMGHTVAMSEIQISEFYLLLFTDKNLDKRIDKGECKRLTFRIKDNYKGWHVPYWNMQDSLGQTPLHKLFLYKQWDDAGIQQRTQLFREALLLESTNLNIQDALGNTAMHYALGTHYFKPDKKYEEHPIQLIKILLNSDRSDVNIRNYYYNNTPLQQYLMEGDLGVNRLSDRGIELVKLFLQRNDLRLNNQNNVNYTAYDYANRKNWLDNKHTGLINKLKAKEQYNSGASEELSQFIHQLDFDASESEKDFYKTNIQLCLDHDANPNVIKYQLARTPLTWFCYTTNRPYGYSEEEIQSNFRLRSALLQQLMQTPGIDINLPDYIGETALHYAVKGKATILVKTLLDNPQTNINSQNSEGNTPLMEFIEDLKFHNLNSGKDIYDCLQVLTSDFERLNLKVINYKGNTTLDLIDIWLLDDGRGELYKRFNPDVYNYLKELKQRIEIKIRQSPL